MKKQAAEQISQLEQQAAGALQDAKQSAQAVRELEGQRQQFVREAEGLRQSLDSLRKQELARANEVATLPTSEVVKRVASRLQEQGSGSGSQGHRRAHRASATTRMLKSAGAGPPLPQGRGTARPRGSRTTGQRPNSLCPPVAALVLSDQGVRKVETAFVELDSCRQQTQVLGQQVSNCEQQSKLNSAIIDQQSARSPSSTPRWRTRIRSWRAARRRIGRNSKPLAAHGDRAFSEPSNTLPADSSRGYLSDEPSGHSTCRALVGPRHSGSHHFRLWFSSVWRSTGLRSPWK